MCRGRFDLRPHGCTLLGQRRLHRGANSIGLGSNILDQQQRN